MELNKLTEDNTKNKLINMNNTLRVTHNAGFFSCCTIRLNEIIKYINKNKVTPIVDSSTQWNDYKDKVGDLTPKLFKMNNDYNIVVENIELTKSLDEEQFSDYKLINHPQIQYIINQYFSPSEIVLEIGEMIKNRYNINLKETITVLYRGNDKHLETEIPTHNEMLEKIKEIKDKYPNHKLLIQSDEKSFVDFILSYYPESIIIEGTKKIDNKNSAVQYTVNIGNRESLAVTFLAALNLISKSDVLITNSGNVSLWCVLYRGNSNNVYQYLQPKEFIYGVKNGNYRLNENKWF